MNKISMLVIFNSYVSHYQRLVKVPLGMFHVIRTCWLPVRILEGWARNWDPCHHWGQFFSESSSNLPTTTPKPHQKSYYHHLKPPFSLGFNPMKSHEFPIFSVTISCFTAAKAFCVACSERTTPPSPPSRALPLSPAVPWRSPADHRSIS